MAKRKMSERKEAGIRIIVCIVSGIVLSVWKIFIQLLAIINWLIVVFSGKRSKELANMCEIWNTQIYVFLRYMTFVTNKRPFPFDKLVKNISKFGK